MILVENKIDFGAISLYYIPTLNPRPKAGTIYLHEPFGSATGTEVVTYKPTEYGKPVQGKLIIQTEDSGFRSIDEEEN